MYKFVWIITCLVVFLTVISKGGNPSLTRSDIQAQGKNLFRALSNSNCKIDCSRKKNRPVCGSDGVTYKNRCELKRAKRCDKKKVKVKRKGPCSPSEADSSNSDCVRERNEALEIARRPTFGVYIPECKQDGTYTERQCHVTSGFCWCVTPDGKPIEGTPVHGRDPACRGSKKRRQPRRDRGKSKSKSKKKKRRKSCKTADKQKFNQNIVQVFTDEYKRAVVDPVALSSDKDKTLAQKVIEWKFNQLDSNKDDILKRRETRTIKRMVRKLIQPKACARRFLEYCDSDRDRMIQRKEWTFCLNTNANSISRRIFYSLTTDPNEKKTDNDDQDDSSPKVQKAIIGGQGISRPGLSPQHPNIADSRPDTEVIRKSCLEEQASSLSQQSVDPNGGIYIPQCTPDGKFNIVQCHKYCWCADQETGTPLKGIKAILASKGPPNCNITAERAMPGCPFIKKARFLTSLLNMFVSEMQNDSMASQKNTNDKENAYENAARWKFTNLDKNKNMNLDRREVKQFRKLIPKQKNTRKCSRTFLRYCDENTNKKISLDEWLSCTKLSESPPRKGKNPLREYLKPS
ncbi:SPARC-related modular calcium-binding protein 1-like isoform X2 [Crassostrea angulata]|uniref:SPARC-related modular calcium-binding protein 1-like isoform X2 n=1 Tax=Magallana angulata TaxID=2784310 RepID=UPI0022B0E007|nr:SPARC-related modular calcium-binding protein 1-like isoform X2 [Crassostrea angulata]